jgi:hypothetical protein
MPGRKWVAWDREQPLESGTTWWPEQEVRKGRKAGAKVLGWEWAGGPRTGTQGSGAA